MSRRPTNITVTDHCVLRYLERVEGLDVEGLRLAIAAIVAPAIDAGAKGAVQDGWRYVLKPETRSVVTVVRPMSKSYGADCRPGRKEFAE